MNRFLSDVGIMENSNTKTYSQASTSEGDRERNC